MNDMTHSSSYKSAEKMQASASIFAEVTVNMMIHTTSKITHKKENSSQYISCTSKSGR